VLQASSGQRIVVATTLIMLTVGYARAALMLTAGGGGAGSVLVAAGCVAALALGVEFADFGTGIYHWAIDNYGSASTPVVGSQIEAFQGHHEEPWTITHRDFCNNCYPTCIATMPFLLGFVALARSPYLLIWSVTACGGIAFCQEFHKYSHTLKSQCHPLANWFQDNGVLVARKVHLRHHRPPFETNYCIVTGHLNNFLDRIGFFRGLEQLVCRLTGVLPRCETGDRFDHLLRRKDEIRGSGAARPRTAATA
jgi:ubiquitin-conjugating enzyme E2 variant